MRDMVEFENNSIETWLKVGYVIARKYGSDIEVSERESLVHIALTNAIKTYNKDKEIKFSTYLGKVIANAIGTYIRDTHKERVNNAHSLDAELFIPGSDTNTTFGDITSSSYNLENDTIARNNLRIIFSMMDERDTEIIKLRFLACKTQHEIAKELNISQTHVVRLLNKISEKAKRLCG